MQKQPNQVTASLTLTSKERPPEEILVATGLQPTRVWRVGEMIEGTILSYSWNGWLLESGLGSDADLESHALALTRAIEPAIPALKELSRSWDIELSCTVYANSYVPPLHFSGEVVQALAAIGAQIDIDLYCGEADP